MLKMKKDGRATSCAPKPTWSARICSRPQCRSSRTGAGRYEAQVDVSQPGAYLVRLGVSEGDASLGQQTLGLVVPYSPEYRASGTNTGFLDELARITGGSRVEEIAQIFLHNLPAAQLAREIWRPLLLIVALLFPLDIALRRVMFGRSDYARAGGWIQERMPRRRPSRIEGRALGNLFQARERARHRRAGEDQPEARTAPPEEGKPPSAPAKTPPPARPSRPKEESGDTLDRLRKAKKRARGDEQE
jgi:Ca-activated chloride channel homolog